MVQKQKRKSDLMNNIIIYNKRSDVENVINLFNKNFSFNKFPLSILKEKNMEFIFIKSKVFYLRHDYNQFQLFLNKNNIYCYYILPYEASRYDWEEYEKEHLFNESTKYSTTPTFLIRNQPGFDLIDEMFMKTHFLHYTEYYIFSEKLDWCVHYVPHRNFIIMYFGKEISFEGLGILEDKITNMDDLVENAELEDGFNKTEIESLENYWFSRVGDN